MFLDSTHHLKITQQKNETTFVVSLMQLNFQLQVWIHIES